MGEMAPAPDEIPDDRRMPQRQRPPRRDATTIELHISNSSELTASQLIGILVHLNELYEVILADAAQAPSPVPFTKQMVVTECNTSNSLLLLLAGHAGAVLGMATLMVGFAKGFASFRKDWHEGSKAKWEGRKLRQEVTDRHEDQTERKAREERLIEEFTVRVRDEGGSDSSSLGSPEIARGLSEASLRAREKAVRAVVGLFALASDAPNIAQIQVNGHIIIDNGMRTAKRSRGHDVDL